MNRDFSGISGMLMPYMFVFWQYTVIPENVGGIDFTYGVHCDGEWGGTWNVTVKDGQFSYETVDVLNDVQAVIHFEYPSDLVLTAYQRVEGGTTTGDPEVVKKIRKIFHTI